MVEGINLKDEIILGVGYWGGAINQGVLLWPKKLGDLPNSEDYLKTYRRKDFIVVKIILERGKNMVFLWFALIRPSTLRYSGRKG